MPSSKSHERGNAPARSGSKDAARPGGKDAPRAASKENFRNGGSAPSASERFTREIQKGAPAAAPLSRNRGELVRTNPTEQGQPDSISRNPSSSSTVLQGVGGLLKGTRFGNLRLQATYSQGGVALPATIPRVTSWHTWDHDPFFSAVELGTQFATAPAAAGNPCQATIEYHSIASRTDTHLEPTRTHAEEDAVILDSEGLTQCQVVVYLVTAIIGCGVVVLPSLMAIGGWIVVPVSTGITTLAFIEMGRVMDFAITCADQTQGKHDETKTFEDLGRAAMDTQGVTLIRAVTGTGFSGTLIVYSMLIGQNVHGLLGKTLSMKIVMAMVTPALIYLALLKDGELANIMSIGMLASLSSCVLICIKGVLDARIWQSWPKNENLHVHSMWPNDPGSLGTVLAVLFSAFSVMGTVPCIRGQMKKKDEFLPAFQFALIIVFAMYLAVMLLGYWGYGNFVQHNVVDSMMFPPRTPEEALYNQGPEARENAGNNPIGVLMALLVTTYLFLGFSLFFKCVAGMIKNLFGGQANSSLNVFYKDGTRENNVLRGVMVVIVVMIGLAVPHFRDLMAIMSSVCCSCNNVFFPLLFACRLEKESTVNRFSTCRRIAHAAIFVLGLFCFSLGLWSSLSNLVHEMGDQSKPTLGHQLDNITSTLPMAASTGLTSTTPVAAFGSTSFVASSVASAFASTSGAPLASSTLVTGISIPGASGQVPPGYESSGPAKIG